VLARLAGFAHRRRRRIAIAAVALAVLAGAIGGSVAERLGPYSADDPDTEAVQASDRLEQATGADDEVGLAVLVRTSGDVRSPDGRTKVDRVAAKLRRDPGVGGVVTYFELRDPALLSRDRHATYVVGSLRASADEEEVVDSVRDQLRSEPGVLVGGEAAAQADANQIVREDLARAEMLAFPILLLLSFWFFRSLVAALLPLLVGGLSIVFTFLALRVASEAVELSVFALNLVIALGLGLAIDYSLFVVSRYREEVARHGAGRNALARTLSSAGRTVLYSSLTVAAALAALLVFPQRFLYSMGLGGMIVALIAATVALVVLPAVLALLGERVNGLAPRRLRRAAEAEARGDRAGSWYRLSRFVMRRPGRVAVASAALLVALGVPFLGIRFIAIDPTVLPERNEARMVEDALRAEFPPFRTSPVVLVAETPPGRAAEGFAERLRRLDGVAAASRPRRVDEGLTRIDVVSRNPALSEGSQELVRTIRDLPAPFEVGVTGRTADFVDQKSSLADHIPIALALLAATTFSLLFLMTGSVVLPLKALVMNLLTLSATFGLLVLVFQDGRLEGLLDYTSQGALESTQPLFLFAVAFGLSTDYGVFLLSRIKEARDAGASDREAVALGLERTGRIVTAAALLFCVAIGAFATSSIVFIKELGLGTALAVLIDATIVRALLVPALMELLGRRNWWAPRPLRRLHARFGLAEPGGARAAEAG
jgi:uncharacterized membrane protein YdfJ with MMPL/SSD domain